MKARKRGRNNNKCNQCESVKVRKRGRNNNGRSQSFRHLMKHSFVYCSCKACFAIIEKKRVEIREQKAESRGRGKMQDLVGKSRKQLIIHYIFFLIKVIGVIFTLILVLSGTFLCITFLHSAFLMEENIGLRIVWLFLGMVYLGVWWLVPLMFFLNKLKRGWLLWSSVATKKFCNLCSCPIYWA